jgi:hypothetical protein
MHLEMRYCQGHHGEFLGGSLVRAAEEMQDEWKHCGGDLKGSRKGQQPELMAQQQATMCLDNDHKAGFLLAKV